MFSVKDLSLVYDLPNAKGGFTEGDDIKGTFTFELKKDTKVQSICIKAKGDANAKWSNTDGDPKGHPVHERFFKVKVYVTPQNSNETVIPKGIHRHNFRVKIPQTTSLPSSFKCDSGTIVYTLEAKITRRLQMDCKVQIEFNLFSRLSYNIYHLMCQASMVEKNVGVFSKGLVQMTANVERGAYAPGERLFVVANVKNSSSKEIRPKYALKQIVVTRFKHNTITSTKVLIKVSGTVIEPKTQKRVLCSVQIPGDAAPSIGNCKILSVEYFLKLYLDVKFTLAPEITFPLLIVPPGVIASHQTVGAAGLHTPGTTAGHPGSSLLPSAPTFPTPYPDGPLHLPHGVPPYSAFPAHAANPLPQQIHPFPVACPSAPPQFASMSAPHFQEHPPPYTSIVPPDHFST